MCIGVLPHVCLCEDVRSWSYRQLWVALGVLGFELGSSVSSVFAVFCMALSSAFRYELPLWELLVIYFPPAFFLSSLCALLGIQNAGEHMHHWFAVLCG